MLGRDTRTVDAPPRDALGLHGDFWSRFLLLLLRIFPAWFCIAMTRPIALLFYAVAAPQRTAIMANLHAIHPHLGRAALWWAGREVFVQFALTYMDRLWHFHLGCPLRWELHNCEPLESRLATEGGVLLFTAHSGNSDIGAAYFARHFQRTIHTVRVPEKTWALQKFRKNELAQAEQRHPRLRVHYSTDEWSLGMELCGLLRSGEVVALQGDRVVTSSPPVIAEHEGLVFALPRGPLVLAEVAHVPCHAVFLTRLGRCHYKLQASPAFYEGDTKLKAGEIARAWVAVLGPFIKENWKQWFVLENILTPTAQSVGSICSEGPGTQTNP